MSAVAIRNGAFSGLKSWLGGMIRSFTVPVLDIDFSLLLAVPKQKVTHSRKRMRMATKQLRNLQNITKCTACGSPKLMHSLCWTCYGKMKKTEKMEAKKRDIAIIQ